MVRTPTLYLFIVALSGLLFLQGCSSVKQTTAIQEKSTSKITGIDTLRLSLDAQIITAKMQQEVGNTDQALSQYRKILSADPTYGAANYGVSQMMATAGRLDSALSYAERAMQSDNENIWYQLWIAQLYQLTGNTTKLINTWENIVKQEPNTLDYYYELSNSYIAAGDISKAIDVLNRVERKIGITEPISLQKQKLWSAINKTDKATKEIENLAKALPQEKKYSALLAESYMKQGNYAKAKDFYDRALAADPNDEYLHISLASYYKKMNQPELAYKELKKGFAGNTIDTKSKLQMLTSFYPPDEFYKYSKYTYDLMEDVMRYCDDSTAYALVYGDVLMHQQKYAEAARQFARHLAVDSSRYEVWESLLICESEIDGGEAQMLNHARRAAALFPLHPLPYYLQGFMYFQHKEYNHAIAMLQQCEKSGFPKGYLQAETYSLLAESYHSTGNNAKCFEYYDRYLELHPDDMGILNNYAYYLAESGEQLDKAVKMAGRVVLSKPTDPTYLDTYAWALYKAGHKAEALQYIRRAIANDTSSSAVLQQHLKIIEAACTGK